MRLFGRAQERADARAAAVIDLINSPTSPTAQLQALNAVQFDPHVSQWLRDTARNNVEFRKLYQASFKERAAQRIAAAVTDETTTSK
jgi:hypothetical protein